MKAPQTMISHCFSQHFDGENNINSTISPIKKPQKPTASHQCESKGPFPPGNQALESLIDTPPESLHKAHLWHKNMAFGGNFGTRYPPKYPMKTQVGTQPSYVPKLQDLQKKTSQPSQSLCRPDKIDKNPGKAERSSFLTPFQATNKPPSYLLVVAWKMTRYYC